MKKILITISAAILVCSMASAQSLKDILKSAASGVANSVTSATTKLDLTSNTWTYTGVGVTLESDNTLSNLAGTAAVGAVESKIDEELAKVGIKSGAFVFNFATDGTFTMAFNKRTINGTYTQDSKSIVLNFGKTLKSFTLNGTVTATTAGCKMVFPAKKFLSFVKTILKVAGTKSTTASTLDSLLDNYDSMQLGFQLSKK